MLGVDECCFPKQAALTGYAYGCRCPRCGVARKRYDGQRSPRPTRPNARPVEAELSPPPSSLPKPKRKRPTFQPGYIGPCRCPAPNPRFIGIFGGYECANCGMPIRERTSA